MQFLNIYHALCVLSCFLQGLLRVISNFTEGAEEEGGGGLEN